MVQMAIGSWYCKFTRVICSLSRSPDIVTAGKEILIDFHNVFGYFLVINGFLGLACLRGGFADKQELGNKLQNLHTMQILQFFHMQTTISL